MAAGEEEFDPHVMTLEEKEKIIKDALQRPDGLILLFQAIIEGIRVNAVDSVVTDIECVIIPYLEDIRREKEETIRVYFKRVNVEKTCEVEEK